MFPVRWRFPHFKVYFTIQTYKLKFKKQKAKIYDFQVSETDDGFDEPVRETIMRDLKEVMNKFKHVISPKKEVSYFIFIL